MTTDEHVKKLAELAEITYNAARCLSRQEAINTAKVILAAGYTRIPELTLISDEEIDNLDDKFDWGEMPKLHIPARYRFYFLQAQLAHDNKTIGRE